MESARRVRTGHPERHFDDGDEQFFDENGFLVRPAPIGLIEPHKIRAYYAGLGGDGHWGPINITHQFYQAFGVKPGQKMYRSDDVRVEVW